MQLSPKKVYKKPPICGNCSYNFESADKIEDGSLGSSPSLSPAEIAEQHEARGEVAYWTDNDKKEVKFSSPDSEIHTEAEEGLHEHVKENDQEVETDHLVKENSSPGQTPRKGAEELLEERVEECLREGYEQGKIKAENECSSMRENANSKLREAELILREAKQRSKEIVASSETKIVELALAVAERLVCTQLKVAPDTIKAIVRETMNMLNGDEQIGLYVNPDDLETCRRYSEQLKEEFPDLIKVEIFSDGKLTRGSCRIESESGVAEYLIEDEKEQLKEMLLSIARKEEKELTEEDNSAYDRH